MAESISASSNSVSRQIYADIKSAFRSYANNSNNSVKTEEETTYTNNGQVTRKAFSDINNSIEIRAKDPEVQEETETTQDRQTNISNQVENTQTQENTSQTEVKQFTLPKNTDTIIAELKRNGLHRTLSAYDIADEYGITYMKAREILDAVNKDSNGFIREYKLPENSTVSYKV